MRTPLTDLLVRTDRICVPGDRERFYREVRRGAFGQVTTGVYAPVDAWRNARPDERHVARAIAVHERRPELVFAGITAALLWGSPLVGDVPDRPVALAPDASGGRSTAAVVRIAPTPGVEPVQLGGVRVVPLAAALVDVARRSPLETALPMLDHALSARPPHQGGMPGDARVTRAELSAALAAGTRQGVARATRAVGLADGASGSPGESLSRASMSIAGVSAPVLQQAFVDADGLIGVVDFWWPECNVIGEFDGVAKYVREEYARGRSAAEIVVIEKRREDRLRGLGPRVVRWGWTEARQPAVLARLLRSAGVR